MPSVLHLMSSVMAAGLGVVFNGYILFVFIWNRRIQTANRLLLFHLAFVDIIFSLVILLYNTSLSTVYSESFTTVTYSLGPRPLHTGTMMTESSSNSHLCQGHGFLWSLLPVVVVWNVCGLSCDRYAAISIPLHYSRLVNTKRASCFVVGTWILGASLAVPPLLGVCPYTFWDAKWACTANCLSSTTRDIWYAGVHVFVAVVLPVIIIIVCNLHMLIISRYHRHRIMSAICEMTLKAQATITHQRNPCYLSRFKGRSAVFTISQVVGSLVMLILPYYGLFMWEAARGKESNPVIASVTTFLLTCTPSVNAYVYGVKSRMLRQTVKRLLQQHLYRREASKDIKRRLSEIFSDPCHRPPPLTRRRSAPAECCRTMSPIISADKQPTTTTDTDMTSKRTKHLFMRSISLPVSCETAVGSQTSDTKDNEQQNPTDVEACKARL